MRLTKYELHAPPPIQNLIMCEPDVAAAVRAFAEDRGPDRFSVMIPESRVKRTMDRLAGKPLTMLVVELWCIPGHNNLTGCAKISITANPRDLQMIAEADIVPLTPLPAHMVNKVKEAIRGQSH